MRIIAHRCGPELYPPLTIASAKQALASGAAYVEMDVRFTSDGVPVVNHDDNTRVLFGCDKKINEMTAQEFLSLRHVADISYPSCAVEHFLQSGVKQILFHCKVGGEPLLKVLNLCRSYDAMESVVFGVERVEDVRLVKDFNPRIGVLAFMCCSGEIEETTCSIRSFSEAGADYIRLWESWPVEPLASVVESCGKKLWIMANNPDFEPLDCGYTSPVALRRWRDFGADAILLNEPASAMKALARS